MSTVSRSGLEQTGFHLHEIRGLDAGESIERGQVCRVNPGGKIILSNASNDDASAEVDGFANHSASYGETLTLSCNGAEMEYDNAPLTPGETLYLAETDGELDTAPTTGDSVGIARALESDRIKIFTRPR